MIRVGKRGGTEIKNEKEMGGQKKEGRRKRVGVPKGMR